MNDQNLDSLIEASTLSGSDTDNVKFVSNIWLDSGEPGDPDPFEDIEHEILETQRSDLSEEW